MVNFSTGSVYGSTEGTAPLRVQVRSYQEKRAAIRKILIHTEALGLRASLRTRVQIVIDELVMNALYHAPTLKKGQGRAQKNTPAELATRSDLDAVEIQFAMMDGRFAIAVRDQAGSLGREHALRLLRAADAGPLELGASGVGLGLIVASASLVDFYLAPGCSTEVVAIFDLQGPAIATRGAHTLRVFTTGKPTHVLRAPSEVCPPPLLDHVPAQENAQASKKAVRTHAPQR